MNRFQYRDLEHFQKVLRTRKLPRAIELISTKHWTYYRDWPEGNLAALADHLSYLYEKADDYHLITLYSIIEYVGMFSIDIKVSETVKRKSLNLQIRQKLST